MTTSEERAAFLGAHPDQEIDWDTLDMDAWESEDRRLNAIETGLDETDILDYEGGPDEIVEDGEVPVFDFDEIDPDELFDDGVNELTD